MNEVVALKNKTKNKWNSQSLLLVGKCIYKLYCKVMLCLKGFSGYTW